MAMNNDNMVTDVVKSEFRKHIQQISALDSFLLNCPNINRVLNETREYYELSSLNLADSVTAITDTIIADEIINKNLQPKDRVRMLSAIKLDVNSFAFRIRCFGEMTGSGKYPDSIVRERTDIRDLLDGYISCLNKYIPVEPSYNVTIKNNIKGRVHVRINPTEFIIVLTNLVLNALMHAHSASNRVDIILNRLDDKAAVSVLDYGRGVDLEKIHCIMKNNIELLANRNFVHKGCGLIVSQKLAERMNAKIFVSNYPSAGAAFTIVLDEEKAENSVYLSDSVSPQIYFDKEIIILACKSLFKEEL